MARAMKRPAAAAAAAVEKETKKRPAATAQTEKPAKAPRKVAKKDPLAAECETISALMATAEDYPASVVNMLVETLSVVNLGTPKETRHEVQTRLIGMVEEVLNSVKAGRSKKAGEAQAKVDGADAEKVEQEAAKDRAIAESAANTEAVEALQKALETAAAKAADALKTQSAALKAQKNGDADLVKSQAQKAELEKAVSEALVPLKESSDMGSLPKLLKIVEKAGKGFDQQLMASAPSALSKKHEERGDFDKIVIEQLDTAFQSSIAELASKLDSGEAGKAERAAVAEGAQTAADEASKGETSCQEALVAAKKASKDADAAMKAAEKIVKNFLSAKKAAVNALENATAEVAEAEEVLALFAKLVEGAPAAEEPAAAEDAPMPMAEEEPSAEVAGASAEASAEA